MLQQPQQQQPTTTATITTKRKQQQKQQQPTTSTTTSCCFTKSLIKFSSRGTCVVSLKIGVRSEFNFFLPQQQPMCIVRLDYLRFIHF